MSYALSEDRPALENPLDVVEEIIAAHEWPFDRHGEEELSVSVAGSWSDYYLSFCYSEENGGLQIICAYDIRVEAVKRGAVHTLLAYVNERMWCGHFDLLVDDGTPIFRHTMLTRGGPRLTGSQLEEMIEIAIGECERYFPAFQFVLWGGKTPEEAVQAAMLETIGEA